MSSSGLRNSMVKGTAMGNNRSSQAEASIPPAYTEEWELQDMTDRPSRPPQVRRHTALSSHPTPSLQLPDPAVFENPTGTGAAALPSQETGYRNNEPSSPQPRNEEIPLNFYKPRRGLSKRHWWILVALLLVLIVTVAIAVPLSFSLQKKRGDGVKDALQLNTTTVTSYSTQSTTLSRTRLVNVTQSETTSTTTTTSVPVTIFQTEIQTESSTTTSITISITTTTSTTTASATLQPTMVAACFGLMNSICANSTDVPTDFNQGGFGGCQYILQYFYCNLLDQILQTGELINTCEPGATQACGLVCANLEQFCKDVSKSGGKNQIKGVGEGEKDVEGLSTGEVEVLGVGG